MKVAGWSRLAIFQALFLLAGSSWLLAISLNRILLPQHSLISFYESAGQPYAWLFRLGDITAAGLLLAAVIYLYFRGPQRPPRRISAVLLIIGGLMLLDPIITVNCLPVHDICVETLDNGSVAHSAETATALLAVFGLSLYVSIRQKRLPATAFVIGQLLLAIGFTAARLSGNSFEALAQYVYQTLALVWLAWYVGILSGEHRLSNHGDGRLIRLGFASLAFAAGMVAIITSLAHQQLFGRIGVTYFNLRGGWLAQHEVIFGVIMLYLSRHLARGEYRARVILLALLYVEIIMYAVLVPRPALLAVYGLLFVLLFALSPYFTRGVRNPSWRYRLQEIGVTLAGIIAALGATAWIFSRSPRGLAVAHDAVSHLAAYSFLYRAVPRELLRSTALAHSLSALLLATVFVLLWSLFRPGRPPLTNAPALLEPDTQRLGALLARAARSSEDYFKLWPADKQYVWSRDWSACLAYKLAGPAAFGLADPLAETLAGRQAVLTAALADWRARGLKACFLPVAEASLDIYAAAGMRSLQVGSNALIDIRQFAATTVRGKWWRWQRNRAAKVGYRYQTSIPPHDSRLLGQLRTISDDWLAQDNKREQGFALGYYDIDYLQACTVHYISDGPGAVVAFTNQLPVFNDLRQTTIDLLRYRPDHGGVMPYLLSEVILGLAKGSDYDQFDLGFVPLADMQGKLAAIAKTLGARRFSAAGLAQFKNKFEPDWQPVYVAYDGDLADLAVIALNIEAVMRPPASK